MTQYYSIIVWVLIFGVFWFFLIRPQQKQQKARKEMLNKLNPGDQIVTIGGIKGKIIKIKDDQIKLRISSNVDIDITRGAVGQVEKTADSETEE